MSAVIAALRRHGGLGATALSFLFFAVRLYALIDRHAVNVIFWDEWDYLQPLRQGASPWTLFSWQHGPHRMGLGYLFIAAVYRLSGWDDRVEAFATGAVFVLAVPLALVLKARVVGRVTRLDCCVPALLLTTAQYELFVGAVNAAHGPIPLLLVLLSPFCWLVQQRALRALLGGTLALCAAFTGFALFIIAPLAVLFFVDAIRPVGPGSQARIWDAVGGLASVAALALFFRGYQFVSAVDCFRFPEPRPGVYIPFAGLEIVRPMHLVHLFPHVSVLGVAAFAFAIALTAVGVVWLLRGPRTPLARTVFLFSSFTLLFVATSAVGRVCLGLIAALAPRYVPYVAPLWLAGYFVLVRAAQTSRAVQWIAGLLVAAFVVLQAFVPDDDAGMRWYSEGKIRWRACFRTTGDELRCNAETGFRVYSLENAAHVAQTMQFLRENRLSLFKP